MRDSLGGAVPDRIPCLKVKLMLPNWAGAGAGGGGTELKKVRLFPPVDSFYLFILFAVLWKHAHVDEISLS